MELERAPSFQPCFHAVVQSLSYAPLFATPWTVARQASLSFTISWSLLKLMSIESVMPSNHLILCCPLLLLPSIFPSTRVFSNESALHIRRPKYCCHESIKIKPIKDTAQSLVTRDRAVAFVVLLFWVHEGLPFSAPAPVGVGQEICSSHWMWAEMTCVTSIKNQHMIHHILHHHRGACGVWEEGKPLAKLVQRETRVKRGKLKFGWQRRYDYILIDSTGF